MKTVLSVFMASMILFSACSSVHFIKHDESSYTETSEKIQGKEAEITLASGQIIGGKDIRIALDSTSWINVQSRNEHTIPTSEIKEITVPEYGKSVLKGLGFGMLGGAFVGYLLGSTYEGDWKKLYQLVVAGGVAALGGIIGLHITAATRRPDRYVFNAPRDTAYLHAAKVAAQEAAKWWLALIDSENYSESWNEAAQILKQGISMQKWEKEFRSTQISLGKLETRKFRSAEYAKTLVDYAVIEKVVIEYESSFRKRESAIETITAIIDRDGQWRVSRYLIK